MNHTESAGFADSETVLSTNLVASSIVTVNQEVDREQQTSTTSVSAATQHGTDFSTLQPERFDRLERRLGWSEPEMDHLQLSSDIALSAPQNLPAENSLNRDQLEKIHFAIMKFGFECFVALLKGIHYNNPNSTFSTIVLAFAVIVGILQFLRTFTSTRSSQCYYET